MTGEPSCMAVDPQATVSSTIGGTLVAMTGGSDSETYPHSPVPGDRRLWPGERPFTAFGQFGENRLDLRVFDQDVWWVDRLGHPHELTQMSGEYVTNLITFLTQNREDFFIAVQRCARIQAFGDLCLFGDPGGDALAVELGGPTWDDLTAETWLESTPLMRALRRRARAVPSTNA